MYQYKFILATRPEVSQPPLNVPPEIDELSAIFILPLKVPPEIVPLFKNTRVLKVPPEIEPPALTVTEDAAHTPEQFHVGKLNGEGPPRGSYTGLMFTAPVKQLSVWVLPPILTGPVHCCEPLNPRVPAVGSTVTGDRRITVSAVVGNPKAGVPP